MKGKLQIAAIDGILTTTIASRPVPQRDFFCELSKRLDTSTHAELAAAIGVPKRTLDGWILGRPISARGCAKIAYVLQTSAN